MPKGSSTSRDLILGLLFFGGLFALGYVTTQLRNLPGMGERQSLNVVFEDVYGVRREDSVLVHGTRYGRVSRIEPIPWNAWEATGRNLETEKLGPPGFEPHVLMVLELELPIELHEGYRIYAEDTNLLGGKVVTILPGDEDRERVDPGPSDPDLDPRESDQLARIQLLGSSRPHPITAIGQLVENNLDSIGEIVENLRSASAGLDDANRRGAIGYLLTNPAARDKFENILGALDQMASQVKQPGSLMNDLFYETPFRNNLNESSARLRELLDKANRPESLLGALVAADSPLKQDVDAIVAGLQDLTERARNPKSMIGRLVDDSEDSVGAKADRMITTLSEFVESSRNNSDSLFYNLFHGDLGGTARHVLEDVGSVAASFKVNVMEPIEKSTGVLGYLINDQDAKLKMDRLISSTLGIIEDAREAAPITSLGSFIFGGF